VNVLAGGDRWLPSPRASPRGFPRSGVVSSSVRGALTSHAGASAASPLLSCSYCCGCCSRGALSTDNVVASIFSAANASIVAIPQLAPRRPSIFRRAVMAVPIPAKRTAGGSGSSSGGGGGGGGSSNASIASTAAAGRGRRKQQ
ncbi:hypothetical protein Vretifemale_3983, partial [Volvox reticuliferus]